MLMVRECFAWCFWLSACFSTAFFVCHQPVFLSSTKRENKRIQQEIGVQEKYGLYSNPSEPQSIPINQAVVWWNEGGFCRLAKGMAQRASGTINMDVSNVWHNPVSHNFLWWDQIYVAPVIYVDTAVAHCRIFKTKNPMAEATSGSAPLSDEKREFWVCNCLRYPQIIHFNDILYFPISIIQFWGTSISGNPHLSWHQSWAFLPFIHRIGSFAD